ncbi:ABC transporter ATP-binding protein [Patescibacteria group bacterium]|nr:MAG: ABC transporter ATP-binding protein [Patescibacteria group bacterium]
MPIVEVKNLSKYYPKPDNPKEKFAAVDDVSFEIKEGETFGILGPNGAGKTTTLEMLEGLKVIEKGEALVSGISVKNDPMRVKQIIGVQLQESHYFDFLKLKELLDLFGEFYHRKIDGLELLREVQLEDKKAAYTRQLSGGQKQRLSIASALVNDPKVLFLDEPTTGLDPQARHNLWDLVKKIKAKGKTIVLTTHYMEEAQILCDRLAIMDHGKIIALDTPDNLVNKYAPISHIIIKTDQPLPDEELKNIPHVQSISSENDFYDFWVSNPEEVLLRLVEFAKSRGIKILSLRVERSTLEDVFLSLTGRELRD